MEGENRRDSPKILPRLRGSRTRVAPLLGALGCYLHSGDKAGVEKFFPAPGEELPEKPVQEIIALNISTYGNKSIHSTPSQYANLPNKTNVAIFPRSFAKVQRMARVVIEEQFVSFIC